MKRLTLTIFILVFACTTVQAQVRICDIFDHYGLSYNDEPCVTEDGRWIFPAEEKPSMSEDAFLNFCRKAGYMLAAGKTPPDPPETMSLEQKRDYLDFIVGLYESFSEMDQSYQRQQPMEVHNHYHQAPVISESPGRHNSSSQSSSLGVYNLPRPYGWDVNENYIPSWRTQYETELRRWRLEQAQSPSKGQMWIDAIPKGDQFRRSWE